MFAHRALFDAVQRTCRGPGLKYTLRVAHAVTDMLQGHGQIRDVFGAE